MCEIVQRFVYPISSLWNEGSNRSQRMRRLAIFFGWQLWKRLVRKPITVELFNNARFIAYPDCQVSAGILYTRIPNSRNVVFLREHLAGGTLIDVGANVGSVSLLLSDKISHAILFEPNPLAAARARENLALNHLKFDVYELALSDMTGEVEFEWNGGVDTVGHVVINKRSADSSKLTNTVPCVTFDEFLTHHGYPQFEISLVKIDVEGHENSVLRGMRRFLLERRPPLITFEYLQRTNLKETLNLFSGVRYQVFELKQGLPVAVKERAEPLQDLFACPQEHMPALGLGSTS